jgi:hypothetical protein
MDEQCQKGLCYKYGLLGHKAASHKQRKRKGFQKKRSISTAARMLGAMLCPDPER